jgi:hypothetical protein
MKESLSLKLRVVALLEFIDKNKNPDGTCTWTVIDRYSGIIDVGSIVEYSLNNNILKNHGYNKYSIINKDFAIKEDDYYQFLEEGISVLFSKIKKVDGEISKTQITARTDSKIAGKWTRPDIVAVSKKKYPYIPDYEFDIMTFEVKRPEDVNVLAVFEALAHRSAASLSYVVFPVADSRFLKPNDVDQRILSECAKHGIGIICVNNIEDVASLVTVLEAERAVLDRARGSDFLRAVLPADKIAAFA